MSYTILSFDGLQLPVLRRSSAEQNMGTGSAQTEFRQLPGGGYYRTRRGKRSPQGIQPVTASRAIAGANAAGMHQQLDAWRSKIGVYGKLTVRFRDGSLRWQWAELQSVSAPQSSSSSIGGQIQDIELIWQTAAQWWYGAVYHGGWTWDDGSWLWDDGTAYFDADDYAWDLEGTTQTIVVPHAGNVPALNLRVELHQEASAALGGVTVLNMTTGQYLTLVNAGAGGVMVADAGSREAYYVAESGVPIVQIAGIGATIVAQTAGAHGLSDGDHVRIEGTDHYDGVYYGISTLGSYLGVAVDPEELRSGLVEHTGTVRKVTKQYAGLAPTDKKNWISLAPGENLIRVEVGSGTMDGSRIVFMFYDHYA